MSQTVDNFRRLEAEIAAVSPAAKILAVSKTFGIEAIRELYDAGVREFGESRLEELSVKHAALPGDIVWHFIGRLQANKVRKVIQFSQFIESVDSLNLLQRIDRIAGEEKRHVDFLFEVNVSGETSKTGLPPGEVGSVLGEALAMTNVTCRGLMTMAPLTAGERELTQVFTALCECRDRLRQTLGTALPVLSMGMSNDYKIAATCGSTQLRIGSLIFGVRN